MAETATAKTVEERLDALERRQHSQLTYLSMSLTVLASCLQDLLNETRLPDED